MSTQIIYDNPNNTYYIYNGIYKGNKLSTKLITDGNTFEQDYTDDLIKYYLDSPDDKSIRLESGSIFEIVVTDASFVTIQGFINDELVSTKTYSENKENLKRIKN